jgi:hypothetical protein
LIERHRANCGLWIVELDIGYWVFGNAAHHLRLATCDLPPATIEFFQFDISNDILYDIIWLSF